MLNEFRFIKGELRRITYLVKSRTERNFSIETCEVELFHENELIAKPCVEINGHEVDFVIDTSSLEHSYYSAIITFRINEEIVKKKMNFEVTDYV